MGKPQGALESKQQEPDPLTPLAVCLTSTGSDQAEPELSSWTLKPSSLLPKQTKAFAGTLSSPGALVLHSLDFVKTGYEDSKEPRFLIET